MDKNKEIKGAQLSSEGVILALPEIKLEGLTYTPLIKISDVKSLKIKRNLFGQELEVEFK